MREQFLYLQLGSAFLATVAKLWPEIDSASINDDTRGAVIPYQIARGSPLILQLWPAGTEYLNRQS